MDCAAKDQRSIQKLQNTDIKEKGANLKHIQKRQANN